MCPALSRKCKSYWMIGFRQRDKKGWAKLCLFSFVMLSRLIWTYKHLDIWHEKQKQKKERVRNIPKREKSWRFVVNPLNRISIRTTWFNIKPFYFAHNVYLCSLCHSQLTEISSLKSIYRLFLLREILYVFCDVETELLNIICMSIDKDADLIWQNLLFRRNGS